MGIIGCTETSETTNQLCVISQKCAVVIYVARGIILLGSGGGVHITRQGDNLTLRHTAYHLLPNVWCVDLVKFVYRVSREECARLRENVP